LAHEIHKHREVRELCAEEVGFVLHTQAELSKLIARFDQSQEAEAVASRARGYFATQRGATKTILGALFPEG